MSSIRVDWGGMDQLVRGLVQAGAQAVPMLKQTINAEAQLIARESIKRTPKKEGTLRRSQKVQMSASGSSIEVDISYGGNASAYAALIHEGISRWGTPITNWSEPGTGAFYLSKPVEEAAPKIGEAIARRLQQRLSQL